MDHIHTVDAVIFFRLMSLRSGVECRYKKTNGTLKITRNYIKSRKIKKNIYIVFGVKKNR
jgi:hypothetical protein